VLSKKDGIAIIMDTKSYETVDAYAVKEVFNDLNEGDQVTFIEMNGKNQIIEKR
jgi:translation elongation factor P/translation initiation factor 5A